MPDKLIELSSYMSPDSLRKTTQLLKNMYDLHTKRYCGYEDINGSQYVGTVENFGSEILLESRKLLMDKPPLNNIFIENTFDFYFDIQYSEIIDTYDQQNMLCAVLRKDVLLSNREYRIRFDNVEIVNIPRSQSWSDSDVYKDPYIKTNDPPVLCMTLPDGSVQEILLKLSDESDINTSYYFRLYDDMTDMYSSTYDEIMTSKTLITNQITDSMNGIPFVWMVVNKLSDLPDIGFENNVFNDSQFLVIGTNGHDVSMVYPALNVVESDITDDWIIKVIPDDTSSFIENGNNEMNYSYMIKEIHLLKYNKDEVDISKEPIEDVCITYDNKYSKMTLVKLEESIGEWIFKKPVQGDYDYDGRTYRNLCYAYTPLKTFQMNFVNNELISTKTIVAGFQVHFKNDYLDQNKVICQNAVSGIHVDVTSDHSDNGVSKKNGTIHNLGDFNGLPKYFSYMIKDTIHRAHIEAYAIRDGVNRIKSSMDKQTAGLIIDSGIPQNELDKVTNDMPVSIKFDWEDQINRRYITIGDSVSISNSISEITFADNNTFGNSKIAKYSIQDKFVYHGNRVFSLGLVEFDPELEIGRVYIISNDDITYRNNDESIHRKSPRTFARICDIPTKFSQLINIKDFAPTLVIDEDYVRTEASFNSNDKEILYNLTNLTHMMTTKDHIIFPKVFDFSTITEEMIIDKFSKYEHLNDVISLIDRNFVKYTICNGGTGYTVDDTFSFYIGGLRVKGIVKNVDEGTVTEVAYLYTNSKGETNEYDQPTFALTDIFMRRSNLQQETIYETDGISSNGEGLTITMTVNEVWWEETAMKTNGIVDDIFLLKLDHFGNIWSYIYNEGVWIQDTQISGIKVHDNIYDDFGSRDNRTIHDVLIYNMINPIQRIAKSFTTESTSYFIPTVTNDEDIFSDKDFSENIERASRNIQNGYFFLTTGLETSSYHDLTSFEIGHINHDQDNIILPSYHDLNLQKYTNKTNKFSVIDNNGNQPSLYVFNPNINTVNDVTSVHRDLGIINSSRPMLLTDIFNGSPDTPDDLIDQRGILSRNIYSFDEYDMSEHDNLRDELNMKTTNGLIQYISDHFTNPTPLKYQNSKYEYTKEMLVDYIMTNTIYNGRTTCVYNDTNDVPESIYRRPHVKLFRKIGEKVVDNISTPVGEQPSGSFQSITSDMFDSDVVVENKKTKSNPLYIFRIDDIDVSSLKDFRLYDDMDNDISSISMLIIDKNIYIAKIDDDNIDWIKIEREVK